MISILLVCGPKTEYDAARTLQIYLGAGTKVAATLEHAVALLKDNDFDGVVIDDDGRLSKAEVKELVLALQAHDKTVPIVALCDEKDAQRAKTLRRFGCRSLVHPETLIDDLSESLRRLMR